MISAEFTLHNSIAYCQVIFDWYDYKALHAISVLRGQGTLRHPAACLSQAQLASSIFRIQPALLRKINEAFGR